MAATALITAAEQSDNEFIHDSSVGAAEILVNLNERHDDFSDVTSRRHSYQKVGRQRPPMSSRVLTTTNSLNRRNRVLNQQYALNGVELLTIKITSNEISYHVTMEASGELCQELLSRNALQTVVHNFLQSNGRVPSTEYIHPLDMRGVAIDKTMANNTIKIQELKAAVQQLHEEITHCSAVHATVMPSASSPTAASNVGDVNVAAARGSQLEVAGPDALDEISSDLYTSRDDTSASPLLSVEGGVVETSLHAPDATRNAGIDLMQHTASQCTLVDASDSSASLQMSTIPANPVPTSAKSSALERRQPIISPVLKTHVAEWHANSCYIDAFIGVLRGYAYANLSNLHSWPGWLLAVLPAASDASQAAATKRRDTFREYLAANLEPRYGLENVSAEEAKLQSVGDLALSVWTRAGFMHRFAATYTPCDTCSNQQNGSQLVNVLLDPGEPLVAKIARLAPYHPQCSNASCTGKHSVFPSQWICICAEQWPESAEEVILIHDRHEYELRAISYQPMVNHYASFFKDKMGEWFHYDSYAKQLGEDKLIRAQNPWSGVVRRTTMKKGEKTIQWFYALKTPMTKATLQTRVEARLNPRSAVQKVRELDTAVDQRIARCSTCESEFADTSGSVHCTTCHVVSDGEDQIRMETAPAPPTTLSSTPDSDRKATNLKRKHTAVELGNPAAVHKSKKSRGNFSNSFTGEPGVDEWMHSSASLESREDVRVDGVASAELSDAEDFKGFRKPRKSRTRR